MVSKERARRAVSAALKEEFNLHFESDADALRAICEMDSLDKMDLLMEIEYELDVNIDTDKLDASLNAEDVDAALDLLIAAVY
jgi:acyl carrier protein